MIHRLVLLAPVLLAPVLLAALTACAAESAAPPQAPTPPPIAASALPVAPGAPATALPPVLEEAIGRVQGLLGDANDAAINATFSPTFLAAIPAEKAKAVFTAAKARVGACKEHRAEQVKNETTAVVRLQCERGAINATIVVDSAPPHQIDGLLLKPTL